jgi:hypothetical protein
MFRALGCEAIMNVDNEVVGVVHSMSDQLLRLIVCYTGGGLKLRAMWPISALILIFRFLVF